MPRTRAVRTGEAVREYLSDILRRELSADHLEAYTYELAIFVEAFGESTFLRHLTAIDLKAYFYGGRMPVTRKLWRGRAVLVKGRGDKVAASTWNRRLQLMDKFLHDMSVAGYCKPNLLAEVSQKKPSRRRFIWLTPQEVQLMLDNPELTTRNMAMLTVAVDHALRSAELRRILIGDYDLDKGELTLKVTKSKSVELELYVENVTPDCAARLLRWLREYAQVLGMTLPELLSHGEYQLFPRQRRSANQWDAKKGKLTGTRIHTYPTLPCAHPETVVQQALVLLGYTPEQVKFNGIHCTRRSSVNNAVKATGKVRTGQAQARHKSEKTTEFYLNTTEAAMDHNRWLAGGGWRAEAAKAGTVVPFERKEAHGA